MNEMKESEIQKIIVKFINKEASLNELEKLEIWLKNDNANTNFNQFVKTEYLTALYIGEYDIKKAKNKIAYRLNNIRIKRRLTIFSRISVAVSILLIFAFSLFQFINRDVIVETSNVNAIDIGSSKAVLTLENGDKIVLEKNKKYQSKTASSNGEKLIYTSVNETENKTKILYNYLTIPRGGEFFIKLSDETKVWLNSESQLKYPVSFLKGETRKVELVYGEAYFEVSPSTKHSGAKFKVLTKKQEVNVVGTEFNIKAYKNDPIIYTTLIEGKVAVSVLDRLDRDEVLIPNQQLRLDLINNKITVSTVDVYRETSWKNGVFSFKNKALKDIMKVLSRWYKIDVVFESKTLENIIFNGSLNKKLSIIDILETISSTNTINYEINNKTVLLKQGEK